MEQSPNQTHSVSECPTCLKHLNGTEKVCPECGCPLSGTSVEIDQHRSSYMMLRDQYQGCMQEALKATKSLYWLSALSLVGNIILGMVQHSSDYWIAAIIVPAIFIPLALWSRRSPYEALLAAVILYILILLLDAVYDPKTLVQGFILKALIIGYLIKGVKAGAESKKIWGQLKEHHWIQAF